MFSKSVIDNSRSKLDDSRSLIYDVTLQIVASLTDDFRGVIYDCNIFIIQTTGLSNLQNFIVRNMTLWNSKPSVLSSAQV